MLFFAVLKHREIDKSKFGKSLPFLLQVQKGTSVVRILVDERLIAVMLSSRDDQSQIKDQVQHFISNILLG